MANWPKCHKNNWTSRMGGHKCSIQVRNRKVTNTNLSIKLASVCCWANKTHQSSANVGGRANWKRWSNRRHMCSCHFFRLDSDDWWPDSALFEIEKVRKTIHIGLWNSIKICWKHNKNRAQKVFQRPGWRPEVYENKGNTRKEGNNSVSGRV